MPTVEAETEDARTTEATRWAAMQPTAEAALDFCIAFLGCRRGASHDELIDATARSRLLRILRAVSWVESAHGTSGANQPARDPMQSGNPGDAWWKELTGQSGEGSRFIRGPNLDNLWANQVAAAAEATTGFDAKAALSKLGDKLKGHTDAKFTPTHSYFWGVIYLIHRINTTARDKSYQCGDLSRTRLVEGAVSYNGGGVPDYKNRIEKALTLIGDLPERAPLGEPAPEGVNMAMRLAGQLSTLRDGRPRLRSVSVSLGRGGTLKAMTVEFFDD